MQTDVVISDAVGELISSRFRADVSSDIARLMTADPGQRKKLLDLIIGEDSSEKIEKSRDLLETVDDDIEDLIELMEIEPTTDQSIKDPLKDDKLEYDDEADDSTDIGDDEITSIDITQGIHEPTIPKKIKIRVRRNPKTHKPGKPGKITNPNRAENLVIQAEKEFGRVPMKVSFIQGEKAFGCDIISFTSQEEKEIFFKDSNPSHIKRFIEVKGRNAPGGSIVLGGNELGAAKEHHERYYLYRVQENDRGKFDLLILQNPVDDPTTDELKKVNPFQSNRSEKWLIEELQDDGESDD